MNSSTTTTSLVPSQSPQESSDLLLTAGGFIDYQPQTQDPGPHLKVFIVVVCLVSYLVLLPLLLGIRQLKCGGDNNEVDEQQRPPRKQKKKKKGFKALADGSNRARMGDYDDDDNSSSGGGPFDRMWNQFQDEEYSTGGSIFEGLEVQWGKEKEIGGGMSAAGEELPPPLLRQRQSRSLLDDGSSSSSSYCALLLTSLLENYHPSSGGPPGATSCGTHGTTWQRQRQQLKKHTLRNLLREESTFSSSLSSGDGHGGGRIRQQQQESATNPLLQNSNASTTSCCGGGGWISKIKNRDVATILQLSHKHALPEFLQGILNLITLTIIGLTMRTSDLVAYLVVSRFLHWSLDNCVANSLFQGLNQLLLMLEQQQQQPQHQYNNNNHQSQNHHHHRRHHHHNTVEAGKYMQITLTLLVAGSMPFWMIWVTSMRPLLEWIQLDDHHDSSQDEEEHTITTLAMDYTYIALLLTLLRGLGDCVHYLLVLANHETYSTSIILLEQVIVIVVVVLWTSLDDGSADLITYGLIQLELAVTFLVWNVGVSFYKGWLEPYQPGLLGGCAMMDTYSLKKLMKQVFPPLVGNVFLGSTWEILMLLAAYLGPAEFATWCILGVLWDTGSAWLGGVCFAGSLRCEALLILGKPNEAFRSAIIVTLMSCVPWILIVSGLAIFGEDVPSWITKDITLQGLLRELIPLLQIGIVISSLGSVIWSLLSSQGRNHVAAFVAWLSSWFVTLPLATTFSVHLLMDLQGQTVAYILGALLAGGIQSYLFFTFRWNESLREIMTSSSSTVTNSLNSNLGSTGDSPYRKKKKKKKSIPTVMFNKTKISVVQQRKPDPLIREHRNLASEQRKQQHGDQQEDDLEDQKSTSSSSSSSSSSYSSGPFGGNGVGSWEVNGDNSIMSSDLSSFTNSTGGGTSLNTLTPSEILGPPKVQRVFSMASAAPAPSATKGGARGRRPQQGTNDGGWRVARPPPPMSPLMEESSNSSNTSTGSKSHGSQRSTAITASSAGAGSSTVSSGASSAPSSEQGSLMGYRRVSDLGTLSREELVHRQRELHKMLNALKATLRYDLGRSKLRILEELKWVLLESPDIVEVEHLDRVLQLMQIDDDCRREVWSAIRQYLPTALQRMGIDKLLENDYLGSHHLKALMDKHVLDSRANGDENSIQAGDGYDTDSVFNDNNVHRACEFQSFGIPTCFVLRK